ncbi:MAG: MraY family glycosyltransferase [Patescibacteria group bacterium]
MTHNDILIYFLAAFGGFAVSVILVPLVIKIANKLGIVDNPKVADRKVHQKITPLSGGVAIFVAVFFMIFLFRYSGLANFSHVPDHFLFGVFIASLFIIIGGVLDDKFSIKPWQQILFPLVASLIVVAVGIKISYVTNPFGDTHSAILYINAFWGTILAFVWLMGMMYTTKFLDGLDGLVGGISVIAAFIIFVVSLSWDVPLSATGICSLALLGGCLGFLIFNYYPAKIFLGESGSIFLGFIIGVLSIISGSKIATTLLVIGIPALDVLWVIIQRVAKKESPFSHADRKHLHYRLLDLGFSRQGAVWFLYLVSLAFGSLAVIGFGFSKFVSFLILIILMIALTVIFYFNSRKNGNKNNSQGKIGSPLGR